MQFCHSKLPNGLEIAAEEIPFARTMALGFFIRCGSRAETEDLSGISHFLEHMIFKGSQNRSAQDVNREFDALGISINAYTSEESTIFYAELLPEFLESCLEIYADILRPAIREEDFCSEKQVILEEISTYENEPPFCMDDRLRRTFFNGFPLGNPVLGSAQSVRALKSSHLQEWHREKYSPKNILLYASGKVDFELLVKLAEKYCGHWENFPESTSGIGIRKLTQTEISRENPTTSDSFPFTPKLGFKAFTRKQSSLQYTLSCSAASIANLRRRLTGRLIAGILGDDSGSRFYWDFVDSGRAEHALLFFTEFTDIGFFYSSLACEPEDALQNRKRIEAIYRDAEAGGITEKELNLAKSKIAAAAILESETAWGRIFNVGTDWCLAHEYRTAQEEMEILRSITLDEIADFLKHSPLTRSLTFSVGPQK